MNKDQLLDAIGMVDEQKIRDAIMVKRTKRISGILTLLIVSFVLAVLILLFVFYGWLFPDTVVDYTPAHIAQDIGNANVVTVIPDPIDRQSYYTIYVPDGTSEVMHFEKWSPATRQETNDLESLLIVRFHDTSLVFYENGYVRAEKHDWDEYIGVYSVPKDLWCEVLTFLVEE